MARGRKRLPQEVLDLRGTARKDRERPKAVTGQKLEKFDIRSWTVPGYEVLSDRARKIYARACRNAIALKILETEDLLALVTYAREYDMYLEACADIAKRGRTLMYLDKAEQPHYYDNPAVHQANNALRNMRAIGSDFGFSPVDRQKLHIKNETDPMDMIKQIMSANAEDIEQNNG